MKRIERDFFRRDTVTVAKGGRSRRIGIRDAKHLLWRFFVEGNGFVSGGKKSV